MNISICPNMEPISTSIHLKPSLPPKPVKYRAPLPPSLHADTGDQQQSKVRVPTSVHKAKRCTFSCDRDRRRTAPQMSSLHGARYHPAAQKFHPDLDPPSKVPTLTLTELDLMRPRSAVEFSNGPATSPLTSSSSSACSSVDSLGDVIYDQPRVELDRKSLERLIRSDGYVKLRSDIESRRSAKDAREKLGGETTSRDARKLQNSPDAPRVGIRSCRSSESVDKLDTLLDFTTEPSSNQFHGNSKTLRSSFLDPNGHPIRKSVYIELGEYQTLLKHSKNDEERVYSLPQPQCYGEDTLKAVKLITEKYDTFKRRQLRALSFRDGTGTLMKTPEDNEDVARKGLPEGPLESNNNKKNEVVEDGEPARPVEDPPKELVSEKQGKESDVGVDSRARQFESLLLRDYCNTLGTYDEPADGAGVTLTKSNRLRIELFYRSRETSVYVCRCLADMFVGTCISEESCPMVHQHTGVPVWLLNSGAGIRSRELLLLLTERETGFPLWQDKINYLSNYVEVSPGTHALRVSGSLRKMVRLHMFCERSAEDFLGTFNQFSSDPHDDLWKISSEDAKPRKADSRRKRKKRNRVSKSSISQPCNFVHISCVDPKDPNFRAAFSGLIPIASSKSPTNDIKDLSKDFDSVAVAQNVNCNSETAKDSPVCEFRPRLPTR